MKKLITLILILILAISTANAAILTPLEVAQTMLDTWDINNYPVHVLDTEPVMMVYLDYSSAYHTCLLSVPSDHVYCITGDYALAAYAAGVVVMAVSCNENIYGTSWLLGYEQKVMTYEEVCSVALNLISLLPAGT